MGTRKVRLGRVTDVDIRLLRVFQVVVQSGGLAAAEFALGIGRSTISTHLSDLETRLGVRLCDRGRSGFALTTHGMKVYQASLQLMRSLEDFQHEVNGLGSSVGGELKVGIVDNLVWDKCLNIVDAFRRFAEIGDQVELSVYVLSPDEIEQRLLDGTLSLGISPVMHRNEQLDHTMLFNEVSYLYCADTHPLFGRADDDISEEALAECSYVRKGYAVNPEFRHTNERLSHHVNAYHVEAIATLILTGMHIGFIPESYAEHWVNRGQMRCIKPESYKAIFEFGALTRKSRSTSRLKKAFIDCLLAATSKS